MQTENHFDQSIDLINENKLEDKQESNDIGQNENINSNIIDGTGNSAHDAKVDQVQSIEGHILLEAKQQSRNYIIASIPYLNTTLRSIAMSNLSWTSVTLLRSLRHTCRELDNRNKGNIHTPKRTKQSREEGETQSRIRQLERVVAQLKSDQQTYTTMLYHNFQMQHGDISPALQEH